MGLIAAGVEAHVIDRPGGIFVRRGEQMSDEDRMLLQTVARAIITDSRGTLAEQVDRRGRAEVARSARLRRRAPIGRSLPPPSRRVARSDRSSTAWADSRRDGREYVITLARRASDARALGERARQSRTSAPSSRRAALAYTWSENAHEFRLTPWHNDPVSDASGEAFYLRDEETGHFWSPTPLPAARQRRPTSPGTASATASSSTSRTAFAPSSASTWPSTRR